MISPAYDRVREGPAPGRARPSGPPPNGSSGPRTRGPASAPRSSIRADPGHPPARPVQASASMTGRPAANTARVPRKTTGDLARNVGAVRATTRAPTPVTQREAGPPRRRLSPIASRLSCEGVDGDLQLWKVSLRKGRPMGRTAARGAPGTGIVMPAPPRARGEAGAWTPKPPPVCAGPPRSSAAVQRDALAHPDEAVAADDPEAAVLAAPVIDDLDGSTSAIAVVERGARRATRARAYGARCDRLLRDPVGGHVGAGVERDSARRSTSKLDPQSRRPRALERAPRRG